jgi:hypothetical protein
MKKAFWLLVMAGLVVLMAVLVKTGFRKPPETLTGSALKELVAVSDLQGNCDELNRHERAYWKTLKFTRAKHEYPGETPDYTAYLLKDNSRYAVIYNKGSEIVFFSFVPDIRYGWLKAPSPGGWKQPLYTAPATDSLLQLIRYVR